VPEQQDNSLPHFALSSQPLVLAITYLATHSLTRIKLQMDFVLNLSAFLPFAPSSGAVQDPIEGEDVPKEQQNPYGFCVVA
jgi:hypothetical protein